MAGNTTVVLRRDANVSSSQAAEHERVLRHLLLCGTIREARSYAEDCGVLAMLGMLIRRERTAIAVLAREALRYPGVLTELRESITTAYSDECAASRIVALFAQLASAEREFGLQRVIHEMMRDAATREPEGSRMRFVAAEFYKWLRAVKDRARIANT
ncbi:MAG: hypothetical protein Q7R85_01190 [bacterium]|nr:hypothetical protein [bacterium]